MARGGALLGQIAKRGFDVAAIVAAAPLLLPLALGVAVLVPTLWYHHQACVDR